MRRAEQRAAAALRVVRHAMQHLAHNRLINKPRCTALNLREHQRRGGQHLPPPRDWQRHRWLPVQQRPQVPVPRRRLWARVQGMLKPEIVRPQAPRARKLARRRSTEASPQLPAPAPDNDLRAPWHHLLARHDNGRRCRLLWRRLARLRHGRHVCTSKRALKQVCLRGCEMRTKRERRQPPRRGNAIDVPDPMWVS